jgi:hypothetical protein
VGSGLDWVKGTVEASGRGDGSLELGARDPTTADCRSILSARCGRCWLF